MTEELWYAVLRDREDNDWGSGSFDYEEAVQMAKERNAELIAVIRTGFFEPEGYIPAGDPICIEELQAGEDF